MNIEPVLVTNDFCFNISDIPSDLPDSYKKLLEECNGGYASEGYFHFFGLMGPLCHNVILWNQSDWRNLYLLKESWFIFAEDILGCQYYIKRKNRICLHA